jgi:uncharacterized protein with LGFP repeats
VIGSGRASRFERGRISWHPEVGAFETLGAIATHYGRTGFETGTLKFPTASPRATPDGTGRFSTFQAGRISWHPTTGARWMGKDLAARYVTLGAEGGVLGFPVADQQSVAGALMLRCQGGRMVWASGSAVEVLGATDVAYERAGALTGVLGLPSAAATTLPDGSFQTFASGRISARQDTAYFCRGPIATRYQELGAELGALGFPTTDEYQPQAGLRRNDFERGTITYDEGTGETTVAGGSLT